MSHPSQSSRLTAIPSRWRQLTGAVMLGTLAGCAGNAQPPTTAEALPPSTAHSTVAEAGKPPAEAHADADPRTSDATRTEVIDHSPIVATGPNSNSLPRQPEQPTKDKDTDMTVLVLDNPELMARSAALANDSLQTLKDAGDAVRKPHQMRFHYGFDKHRLSDEDREILRAHAAYMKAHPEVTIEIDGHTDNFGNEEYNTFLSRLRANTAAKVLKAEGIRDSRIKTVGWGSHKPLATPEDHAANRRLELTYHSEQMAKAQ